MTEPDGIRSGSPGQGPGRGSARVGEGLAIRHSGDVLLGGAPGAGGLLLNTKASQEDVCSRAPAAIVPGPEPEPHDAGVSRFAENGSHLAEVNATEGLARQVGGSGSSGNAENGSHLEAADFSNEPGAVLWRHTPPRRTESGLLSYGTASPDSSVQKTALWRTRAHLSAGAARGGGSSAGATESWAIGGWWLRDWAAGGREVSNNEQNNDLSCLVLLTGKVLFYLIVRVLSATAETARNYVSTQKGQPCCEW